MSVPASSGSRPSSATSRGLLDRVRARDGEAWSRLVRLYAPLVAYWARRRGVAVQDVADLVQDVFRAVARRVGDFRHDRPTDTFRGWLHRITRNRVHDYFRERERHPPAVGGSEALARLAQLPEPELPDDPSEVAATADLLRRALTVVRDGFEPRTWEAFWRTAVDGRPTADVAAELGMSAGAVRVARSRVLARLRGELGELGR